MKQRETLQHKLAVLNYRLNELKNEIINFIFP